MQVIDKKWQYGTYKAFANVSEDLLDFTPGCRVQPAPYVGKSQAFYLINRYEPGENKFFPKGGFEVRGEMSGRYSFELDQVIVYKDGAVKAKATPKKAAAAPKEKKVCGAPKKDGTPCQMKTDGGLCRHHKAK
jgi:hypothetical protein